MPKVVDHAQRRTEIVHGLWQVILERGIDGVTFRAVAEAAEVSIGRVQHYFDSKRELVLEGCRQLVGAAAAEAGVPEGAGQEGESAEAGGDVVGNLPPEAAEDALTALLGATLQAGDPFRNGAAVWAAYRDRGITDPEIGALVGEAQRGLAAAVADLLRAAGGTAPSSGEVVALTALADGLTQQVLLGLVDPQDAREVLAGEVRRRVG